MDALVKDAARLPLRERKGFRGCGKQSWQTVRNDPPSGFRFPMNGFCAKAVRIWKRIRNYL